MFRAMKGKTGGSPAGSCKGGKPGKSKCDKKDKKEPKSKKDPKCKKDKKSKGD